MEFRCPVKTHRGMSLIATAVILLGYGYGLVVAPHTAYVALRHSNYAFQIMSADAWGAIWLGVGLASLIGSMLKPDWPAFSLDLGLLTTWTVGYMVNWIRGDTLYRPWLSASIFAALSLLVATAADWSEPRNEGPSSVS